MLFPGKYWSAYWRLIKVAAGMAGLGCLAWGALVSLGWYRGYAELVLATVVFAPVGTVFILHGLGIFYAVALRLRSLGGGSGDRTPVGAVGSVALIAAVFVLSGILFAALSVQAFSAILNR